MFKSLYIIAITLLLTIDTFSQFKLPLKHRKIQSHGKNMENQRHSLFKHEDSHQSISLKRPKLAHNYNFLKAHYQSNHQNEKATNNMQNHHLTSHENQQNDHLKLQTFNLSANVYSFSLLMNIGGYDYDMSIDSGSSDIFIKGQKSQGQPEQRYQCGEVCLRENRKYTIGYLDGRLRTYETTLPVKIGDLKFNESVLVAYQVDDNFEENQGLIGLSFPQLATNPNPTFIQTLQNEEIIDEYAFGVNLNFQNQNRSFITFGSYDEQFFEGQMKFFQLTSRLFYYINSDGVSVGSGPLLKVRTALLDTGNTCISIPHQHQKQILKQFQTGEGAKQNKCYFSVESHAPMFSVLRCKIGDLDAMPDLNIHLNGQKLSIEKQFYIQACDRRPSDQNLTLQVDQGFWYCDLYIESVTGMRELFLGDGFFNRYYTYFDLQRLRVGMAKNREEIQMQTLISNELDTQPEDWVVILSNLNKDESIDEIKDEANNVDNSSQSEQNKDNEAEEKNLWQQFLELFGLN